MTVAGFKKNGHKGELLIFDIIAQTLRRKLPGSSNHFPQNSTEYAQLTTY
jgi:hypothetical protein